MMFLIRSAFWLGCVFNAMPFKGADVAESIGEIWLAACRTAKAESLACFAGRARACQGAASLACFAAPIVAGSASRTGAPASVDSLQPGDRAASWRGRTPQPRA